jgi:hypothetical protein
MYSDSVMYVPIDILDKWYELLYFPPSKHEVSSQKK